MANFSFGKFFGKGPRQPRFKPAVAEGLAGAGESVEPLPVGRLVSFTEHGPEDAPLFQELEPSAGASPFSVVGGARPSLSGAGMGGLPGPSRTVGEEGFTADELVSMVPAQCVRAGAVPPTQVIPLPHAVLRASLGAGQPAILLSQLHQACPELFLAPSSLDQDLVIALPPQKVQRLVARVEATSAPVMPPPPTALPPGRLAGQDGALEPLGWTLPGYPEGAEEAAAQAFVVPPSKVKLPPPRRKFDEMQGADLRPLVEKPAPLVPGGPFMELGAPAVAAPAEGAAPGLASPFQMADGPALAAAASPFQVSAGLPSGPSGRSLPPRRFESPFAVVSPAEVPAVLESPFARQPMMTLDGPPTPPPPSDPPPSAPPESMPQPPSSVSLRLSALLQGQNAGTLGFAPERVPTSVRVTLPTGPLLAQVALGRIRVRIEDVVAGLEAKFQPAFKGAQPGLELLVPLRELFDSLPEATPPTPVAPPVASAFETPFSIRAEEDKPLTALNSPFQLAPSLPPSPPALPTPIPPTKPAETFPPAAPALVSAPPPPVPLPVPGPPAFDPAAVLPTAPFVDIPDSGEPEPSRHADLPTAASPFLLVPEEPLKQALSPAPTPLPPPVFTPLAPTAIAQAEPTPLAPPPPQLPVPPLHNPFALAPGQGLRSGLGLDLPMMSFDDDPVPLESLREDESTYHPAPPPVVPSAVAPSAPPSLPNGSAGPALQEPPALDTSAPAPTDLPAAIATSSALPPSVSTPVITPEPPPPVVRRALSEQEPLPPPDMLPVFQAVRETDAALVPPDAAAAPAERAPAATWATPLPEPAAPASLAPLVAEGLGAFPSAEAAAPAAFSPAPSAEVPPAAPSPWNPGALADAAAFNVAPPPPTADDRAAFAFVFAPSALVPTADGAPPPLGAMDSLPAIELAKLPPLGDDLSPPPPPAPVSAPASIHPGFTFTAPPSAPVDATPAPPAIPPWMVTPVPETTPAPEASLPPLPIPAPPAPAATSEPATLEDLSFGYVDTPAQLALRAVFGTDRTLGTQDVVDLVARLDGLRACLVHTPHAGLQSPASSDDNEEVRHFRDRAGALFEKTASLVRELDPSAREQSFTLRTGKGVVSFFAIDDVCLAVLHAEPAFRPGVREKLTLVVRTVADMLAT